MKYTYAYKTSDGVRHEASMDAESREAVFAALRAKGIKAIKVVAADGSKANGEVRGRRRLFVLSAVCIVLGAVVAVLLGRGVFIETALPVDSDSTVRRAVQPLPRQEIGGDRRRIEGLTNGLSVAEAFLARFAEPGRPYAAPRSEWPGEEAFNAVLFSPIYVSEGELTEVIDLKRIVAGMKIEMIAYLRGRGTVAGYVEALVKRQDQEISIREKLRAKLDGLLSGRGRETDDAYDQWLRGNARLQALGIYPLPLPRELQACQQADDEE